MSHNQSINSLSKRGFTIVELAIVLVVIGIILSMAVKGRELVRVAQVKADIVKIEKMRTALHIVYAKRNGQLPDLAPGIGGSAAEVIDKQQLFDEGIIRPDDMFSRMVDQPWQMQLCAIEPGEPFHHTYARYLLNQSNNSNLRLEVSVCASLESGRGSDGLAMGHEPSLFCYYEHALDDDNFTDGDGKFMSHRLNTLTPMPIASDFANCDSMPRQKVLWMYNLM
jgi:prepilin-type N-terminal cleavage/methylation domain-containing protein